MPIDVRLGGKAAAAVSIAIAVVVPSNAFARSTDRPAARLESQPLVAPDAAQLLERIRQAAGASAWQRVGLLRIDGRLQAYGLEGAYVAFEDVRSGRFDRTHRFPVFAEREVWDGKVDWRQDKSGGVHRLDGAFAMKRHATDAWLAARGWLRPDAGGAFVGPVTMRTIGGRAQHVVTAVPRDGQAVTLFFDADSLDLVRSERAMPTSIARTRYGDWRSVDGVRLPFSIENDDGDEDVAVLRVTRYALNATPDATTFTMPIAPHDWSMAEASVTVPMDLRNGVLTIAARVNGQGPYRFILDTGGHAILSPALVRSLLLDTFGAGVSGGAGESLSTERYTRVAKLEIGGLVLTDQHFYVIDLGYPTMERGDGPPLGGILGLELLERLATRIDYPGRTVRFTPFGRQRIAADDVQVPIRFDDDMPLVDGVLDDRPGTFALDTGNSSTIVVQPAWADRVGLAASLKAGMETASYGAGGISRNWVGRVDAFAIGGHTIARPLVRYAEDRRGAFSSRTEAGNIGTQVLANYVVDFDYRRGTMGWRYVPGYVPPPYNRAGVRALKDRPDSFVVVVAARGSPAERADVRAKDRIVAIDGRPARSLSGADFNELFAQPVGTVVHLSIERGDVHLDHDVRLEEVVR